jgi:hypothetical protein
LKASSAATPNAELKQKAEEKLAVVLELEKEKRRIVKI